MSDEKRYEEWLRERNTRGSVVKAGEAKPTPCDEASGTIVVPDRDSL
jgi:hypothetical protein